MTLYHVHVTTKTDTCPKGFKKTEIVLEGAKTQVDCMFTKHYKLGVKGFNSLEDILSDVKFNFKSFDRVKVEQDSDFHLPVSNLNYVEVHAKVKEGSKPPKGLWVRSKNPKDLLSDGSKTFFYNKRVYEAESVENAYIVAQSELEACDLIEVKLEQVVFDSNREHDSWWA